MLPSSAAIDHQPSTTIVSAAFDPAAWSAVPFHFWSVVFFVFGSMVGSFLNVCIHRLPLGQSVVSPGSHCPACKYAIPWYLNIPLLTWVYLGGKCRNCRAPISVRYFLVELLTAIFFCGCWLAFGAQSAWLALIYSFFLAGLIAATFIDAEHEIIPDEITVGGILAGLICSCLLPLLHRQTSVSGAMRESGLGIVVGAGIIYFFVRMGKLVWGRQTFLLPPDTRIIFTETGLVFPDKEIPYEEVFYRPSDTVCLHARIVELVDRCYREVQIRLSSSTLQIGDEKLNPEEVPYMEAVTDRIVVPREAMGLGDLKFMAAVGAFLGWQGVLFSLFLSSALGSVVGLSLTALGRKPKRLAYGPYISTAAALWIFAGHPIVGWYMRLMASLFSPGH
jgi:leader peptidase (prepilin peptidase)/N-methyltransferase